MNSLDRLILGTVQFGLPYGINNTSGQPSFEEVKKILKLAKQSGIRLLDTADGYGTCQEQLAQCDLESLGVMSKFSLINADSTVASCLEQTLARLQKKSIYAYSFHRYRDFVHFKNWAEIEKIKSKNLIQKFGVSVYSSQEMEIAAASPHVDLIQMPLNLLDNGMRRRKGLELAAKNNKLVHVRSIFLQGLFFKDPKTLTRPVDSLRDRVQELQNLAQKMKMSMEELCFAYVLSVSEVGGVVIGVDNEAQLQKNIASFSKASISVTLREEIESLISVDEKILNPGSWIQK